LAYIHDVLHGKITVCKYIRLAVERHVRDLEKGAKRGLRFSPEAARYVINFFSFLRHSKGRWAKKPFELAGWQHFLIWVLFGWQKWSEASQRWIRRFSIADVEVARKNGKSTIASGLALYLFVADGEAGAEVYTAATKRDQAMIVYREAVRMVQKSPELRKWIEVSKQRMTFEDSVFEPLGADANTLDGLGPSAAIVDETHAHKTPDVWEVLETATGAREQAMLASISTAGWNRQSIKWTLREHSRQVLEGVVEDDKWFALIFTLDDDDEWTDPKVWVKANPNLGVSVSLDDLAGKIERAKQIPSAQNNIRRKNLNQWVSQQNRYVPMHLWSAQPPSRTREQLKGQVCKSGLDMAKNEDLAALAHVFPDDDGGIDVQVRLWIPRDRAEQRQRENYIPYLDWAKQGYIELCDEDVIDPRLVKHRIIEDAQWYYLEELAFDPWNAHWVSTELAGEGIQVFEFGQNFKNYNEPTREVIELLRRRKLRHGNHPVLTWCADNLETYEDVQGNVRPTKPSSNSPFKIDGMAALIMAIGRALANPPRKSVYSEPGRLIEL
jgi:phage terminase large subunit-like protein